MEVLSDVLRSLKVSASVYFCDNLHAPWSLLFEDADRASFHMLRRGQGWLLAGNRVERLGPGDFLFAGPGRKHELRSEREHETADAGATTLLLCGYCRFDAPLGHALLASLPEVTVVHAEQLREWPWLQSTLDHVASEYMSQSPGSAVVVDKLTEILVVELFRANFGRGEANGFMRALQDKAVSAALSLLHQDPANTWTLDELARRAALSRAAFARRFRERVGQTVFEYLTRLRMQRAQELLSGTSLPIAEIASRSGYESELAFAKAFKRTAAVTPAHFRREAAERRHNAAETPA